MNPCIAAMMSFLALGAVPPPEANTWVKISPLKDGAPSPGMGYEASLAYDPRSRLVLRWGGHNQGGGGEQNSELWAFDPSTGRWALREPNTSPPGVCCAQQNLFDPVGRRFLRFAAFSGNHGWQWFREIYLNNTDVWGYDPDANVWRDLRPAPAPATAPLRCASWDDDAQAAVVFGGEGSQDGTLVYDPYVNTWTRMNPERQPAFRSGGNMAYDAARRLHLLFGVQFGDDPHTWAYDLRRNEWRDLKPAAQPPTDRNDAVLAFDAAAKAVTALVRVVDTSDGDEVVQGHLETWAYDADKNTWAPRKPAREPDGFRSRRRILTALPDQNLLLLENYINPTDRVPGADREQQVWVYRFADAKPDPRPTPPPAVTVTTAADGVTVKWEPCPSDKDAGCVVYRGEGDKPWLAHFRPVGRADEGQTSYRDKDVKPGVIYTYFVKAVTPDGRESTASVKVRAQPHLVEDAIVSVMSPKEVRLSWTPPPGKDVVGYHVERAVVEVLSEDQILRLKKDTPSLAEPSVGAIRAVGPYTRLTAEPVKELAFTDDAVDLAKPLAIQGEPVYVHRSRPDQLDADGKPYRYAVYAYRVRAVNALGVEGGPSPYFLTIPSAPQGLFAKEDDDACRLKWKANLEQKLAGYRVYRMEGPRVNGPGQPVTRLTADPVGDAQYTDPKAGRDTRRFYVVAVDALGQEGFPSSPAWHYREYRRYYVPFVGEWHQ